MVLTFPHPQALSMIPHTNRYPIHGVNHCSVLIKGFGFNSSRDGGQIFMDVEGLELEPNLLQDCSGLFGTLKHYYFFLVCYGKDSPVTNHPRFPIQGDNSVLSPGPLHFSLLFTRSFPLSSQLCHISLFQSVTCTSCFILCVRVPNAMKFSVYSSICK